MKSILISIKTKWVTKILNGEKTIEIRKTCPSIFKHLKSYEGASLDVYIYCTKGNHIGKFGDGLYHEITKNSHWSNGCSWNMPKIYLEGKVVAKFTLNKVEEIENHILHDYMETKSLSCVELKKQSCLDLEDLYKYLGTDIGYAWHISNLVIFDKPKELSEFKTIKNCYKCWHSINKQNCLNCGTLTKAPQSWQFIETGELL